MFLFQSVVAFTLPCVSAKAQEWYREDAVGLALSRALGSERQTEQAAASAEGHRVEEAHETTDGITIQHSEDAAGGSSASAVASSSLPAKSRGDVFVTTKIHPRDFGADRLRAIVETSRHNLNVSAGWSLAFW